jgi:hypothetical protein
VFTQRLLRRWAAGSAFPSSPPAHESEETQDGEARRCIFVAGFYKHVEFPKVRRLTLRAQPQNGARAATPGDPYAPPFALRL